MRIQIPLLQVTTSDGFDVTCDVAFMSCATNGDASFVVNVLEEEQEDQIGEIASNSDLSTVAENLTGSTENSLAKDARVYQNIYIAVFPRNLIM